ncbi:MAG: hypothetical protein LBS43_08300 [Prevotellaceae bacterium]|nr:hypothetical protein [Prevotellaceae bacterium]
MRNLMGLITLLSITVGNVHSQVRTERIEFDTVFNDGSGYFHFHIDNMEIGGRQNTKSQKNGFGGTSIINNIEAERQRLEEDRRALERYIDSVKVILFTNTMGLTQSEAVIFWPKYESYQKKLDKIHEKRREANAKMCDPFRSYKIKEYQALVDVEVKSYREEAMLREQYAEEFKTILGSKLYLLYRAEHLFARWIYSNF